MVASVRKTVIIGDTMSTHSHVDVTVSREYTGGAIYGMMVVKTFHHIEASRVYLGQKCVVKKPHKGPPYVDTVIKIVSVTENYPCIPSI